MSQRIECWSKGMTVYTTVIIGCDGCGKESRGGIPDGWLVNADNWRKGVWCSESCAPSVAVVQELPPRLSFWQKLRSVFG